MRAATVASSFLASKSLSCKSVADSRRRFNQRWLHWIGLDLLPQMCDVNAQVLPMLFRFRAPDFAQDVSVRENASGMSDEQAEQGVLGGGQFDFTAGARYHTRRKIDNQIADS